MRLVAWPPAAYRADDYYMNHVPGTRVWYKTVQAWPGTRVPYQLSPNDRASDRDFTRRSDPLNPRMAYDDSTPPLFESSSLLELPGAPGDQWARRTPARRGLVETQVVESALMNGRLEFSVYTPPGFSADQGPYPLVILFNGFTYVRGSIDAPTVLDNLIADGRIRAPVSVGRIFSATSRSSRRSQARSGAAVGPAAATSRPTFTGCRVDRRISLRIRFNTAWRR